MEAKEGSLALPQESRMGNIGRQEIRLFLREQRVALTKAVSPRSLKKADWVKEGNKKPACFSANCIQNLLRMHPPSPTLFPSSHFSAIIAA